MPSDLRIPQHLGYIVDGNRRWAKQRGLGAYDGHVAGYNAMKEVVMATFDAGVKYVSAYIFSTENWKRSSQEVSDLMGLVLQLFTKDLHIFQERDIRLVILGSRERVSDEVANAIDGAEQATANNQRGTFAICFNYGGRLELVDAVKKVVQSGKDIDQLSENDISQNLYHPEVPDVDLLVRTSGEQRLSNFMLWRVAYSELLFLEKYWPDMTARDVSYIIEQYNNRQRRYGK